MRHILRKAGISPGIPDVAISADEYAQLERARGVLVAAFAIEEKYEVVLVNFLTLEKQLLETAATEAMRGVQTYFDFFAARSPVSVCVVNLLAAARLYRDTVAQDIGDCMPIRREAVQQIKDRFAKEKKDTFEYRFMEEVRNYAQHHGIPVHHFTLHGGWTTFGEDGRMEFAVFIAAQKRRLKKDRDFDKAVLDEMPEEVDLKVACRSYVESLSTIHKFARDLVAANVKAARETIEAAHARYAAVHKEKLSGLTALALDDEGREMSSVPLLLDWDDVRVELQKRNRQLVNLRKRYVTGRATNDKK